MALLRVAEQSHVCAADGTVQIRLVSPKTFQCTRSFNVWPVEAGGRCHPLRNIYANSCI